MNFFVENLGCRVNRVESDTYRSYLEHAGHSFSTDNPELIIINSCAVTQVAEKKTKKVIRRYVHKYPEARVIVTGCASALHPNEIAQLGENLSVVEKAHMIEYLQTHCSPPRLSSAPSLSHNAKVLPDKTTGASLQVQTKETKESLPKHSPINLASASLSQEVLRVGDNYPTRIGLKIQDGCNNACSFCIVHVARGTSVSKPLDQITTEIMSYARIGVPEIVLTGINLGSWHEKGMHLEDLLERIMNTLESEHLSMPRLRLSSIEPHNISPELIDCLAYYDQKICQHLHLPLQAGSSKVLKEMNRHYSASFYKDLVSRMRARLPRLSLSTDVIVGFPGETEEDFAQTISLARFCRFSKMHIFPYSIRQGTPAAIRTDQIPQELKKERVARLSECASELRSADYLSRAGTKELFVVESSGSLMSESGYNIPLVFFNDIPSSQIKTATLVEQIIPEQALSHVLNEKE